MSFTENVVSATVSNEIVDGLQTVGDAGITESNSVVAGGEVQVLAGGTVIDGTVTSGKFSTADSSSVVDGLVVSSIVDHGDVTLAGGAVTGLTLENTNAKQVRFTNYATLTDTYIGENSQLYAFDFDNLAREDLVGTSMVDVTVRGNNGTRLYTLGSVENLDVVGIGYLYLGVNAGLADYTNISVKNIYAPDDWAAFQFGGNGTNIVVENEAGFTGKMGIRAGSVIDTLTVTNVHVNGAGNATSVVKISDLTLGAGANFTTAFVQLSGTTTIGGGAKLAAANLVHAGEIIVEAGGHWQIYGAPSDNGGTANIFVANGATVKGDWEVNRSTGNWTIEGKVERVNAFMLGTITIQNGGLLIIGASQWFAGKACETGAITVTDGTLDVRTHEAALPLGIKSINYNDDSNIIAKLSDLRGTAISYNGTAIFASGATVFDGLVVNDGSTITYDIAGGTMKNSIVNGGLLTGTNGEIIDTIVNDGTFKAQGDAVVSGVRVNGGAIEVDTAAFVTNVQIYNGAEGYVYGNSEVSFVNVLSGGKLTMSDPTGELGGASAHKVNVLSGGTLSITGKNVILTDLVMEQGAALTDLNTTTTIYGEWNGGDEFYMYRGPDGKLYIYNLTLGAGGAFVGDGEYDTTTATKLVLAEGAKLTNFSVVNSNLSGTQFVGGVGTDYVIGKGVMSGFTMLDGTRMWFGQSWGSTTTVTDVVVEAGAQMVLVTTGAGWSNEDTPVQSTNKGTQFSNVIYRDGVNADITMECGAGMANNVIMDGGRFVVNGYSGAATAGKYYSGAVNTNTTMNGGQFQAGNLSFNDGVTVSNHAVLQLFGGTNLTNGVNLDEDAASIYRNFSIVDGNASGLKLENGGMLQMYATDGFAALGITLGGSHAQNIYASGLHNSDLGSGNNSVDMRRSYLSLPAQTSADNVVIDTDALLQMTAGSATITNLLMKEGGHFNILFNDATNVQGTTEVAGVGYDYDIINGAGAGFTMTNGLMTAAAGSQLTDVNIFGGTAIALTDMHMNMFGGLLAVRGGVIDGTATGGTMYYSAGGFAESFVQDGATLMIQNGFILNDYDNMIAGTINNAGRLNGLVASGAGTVTNSGIISGAQLGGSVHLTGTAAATYNDITFDGAVTVDLNAMSGMTANGWVINTGRGGTGQWNFAGAVKLNDMVYNAGVAFTCYTAGTVINNLVMGTNGSWAQVNGTTINGAKLYGTGVNIQDSGASTYNDVELYETSKLWNVNAGTVANNITVYDTALFELRAGTVTDVTMYGGNFDIAERAGENGQRFVVGDIYVENGRIYAKDTTATTNVSGITSLTLAGGAVMDFAMTITAATMTVNGYFNETNARLVARTINFEVDSFWTHEGWMVSDYANTMATAINMSIANVQQASYAISATGAGINARINVTANGDLVGAVTANEAVEYNGYFYQLVNDNGALSLQVSTENGENFFWPTPWANPYAPNMANAVVGAAGDVIYLGEALENEGGYVFYNNNGLYSAAINIKEGTEGLTVYGTGVGPGVAGGYALESNWIKVEGGTGIKIFGTGDDDIVDGVNIYVAGGEVDQLWGAGAGDAYAGTDAGGYAVNIRIDGGAHKSIYGGAKSGTIYGDILVDFAGGSFSGVLSGGGTGDVNGDIYMTINASETSFGNIYAGAIDADVNDIFVQIDGGVYRGMIFAGGRSEVAGGSAYFDITALTIGDGVYQYRNEAFLMAGFDTAWIFGGGHAVRGGYVDGLTTNVYIGASTVFHVVGGSNADGAGSEAYQLSTYITIDGTMVNGNIFGGGYAHNGGISTVDGSSNITIVANDTTIVGNIFGGGANPTGTGTTLVTGDSYVTFTGAAEMLNFNGTVNGDGVVDGSVAGTKYLYFSDFVGEFEASIVNMDVIAFEMDTVVSYSRGTYAASGMVFDLSQRTDKSAFATTTDSFVFDDTPDDNFIEVRLSAIDEYTLTFSQNLFSLSDEANLAGLDVFVYDANDNYLGTFTYGQALRLTVDTFVKLNYEVDTDMVSVFYQGVSIAPEGGENGNATDDPALLAMG